VWLFATERERPLACGQERFGKQGRDEVERDVWRKWRHGEGERVCVCDRDPLGIVWGLYGWEIERQGVCAIERYPGRDRDIPS
jgi:hypothetical protein